MKFKVTRVYVVEAQTKQEARDKAVPANLDFESVRWLPDE
jgi:hypothetical protein